MDVNTEMSALTIKGATAVESCTLQLKIACKHACKSVTVQETDRIICLLLLPIMAACKSCCS